MKIGDWSKLFIFQFQDTETSSDRSTALDSYLSHTDKDLGSVDIRDVEMNLQLSG